MTPPYLFNYLLSVGVSAKAPLVGGARVGFGVSYENEEWDAGFIVDADVPTLSAGKMFVAKGAVDVNIQEGDFLSNAGDQAMDFRAGYHGDGVDIQRNEAGVTGGGVSFGPQFGVEVTAQKTSVFPIRTHIIPMIDKVKRCGDD